MRISIVLSAVVLTVLAGLVPIARAQDKTQWPGDDDCVVAYYCARINASPAVGEIGKTDEWKTFVKGVCKKVNDNYQQAKAKSKVVSQLDEWANKTAKQYLDGDALSAGDVLRDCRSATEAIALSLELDPAKSWTERRVSGMLTFIVNPPAEKSKSIGDFLKKNVKYKPISDADGITVVQIEVAQQTLFVGKTKLGKSKKTALVLGRDAADVVARIKLYSKADALAKQLDANKTVLKSVSFNKRLVAKMTPNLGQIAAKGRELKDKHLAKKTDTKSSASLLPGINPVELAQSVLERVESVSYCVEQKNPSTIAVALQINATSQEGAEELHDIIVGAIALFKIQSKKAAKADADNANRKIQKEVTDKVCNVCKYVTFTHSDRAFTAKADLPNDDFVACTKTWLKHAAKKMTGIAL